MTLSENFIILFKKEIKMETIKNFCVSVLCSLIICIIVVFCFVSIEEHQKNYYSNIAVQEIISMLEAENEVRVEWLNNGGDKEYLEEKIAENKEMIERFKMEIKERES